MIFILFSEFNQQKGTGQESLEEFRKWKFLIYIPEIFWNSRAVPDLKQDGK